LLSGAERNLKLAIAQVDSIGAQEPPILLCAQPGYKPGASSLHQDFFKVVSMNRRPMAAALSKSQRAAAMGRPWVMLSRRFTR